MTKIWVPKFKIVEPKREIVARTSVAGRFKLRTRGPRGRRESPWFDNLILDAGLNRNGASNQTHGTCAVGTGSAAPAVGNTQLESFLASTTGSDDAYETSNSSPYYARKTWTYHFGQGVAEGNLTEVGVGWSDTDMYSRALIEDDLGSPTSFTVLADEFLDVTYQLTCFVPLVDVIDNIDISGNSHDIVMRASDATDPAAWEMHGLGALGNGGSFEGGGYTLSGGQHLAYDGAIGAITAAPGGNQSSSSSTNNASYVADSFQRDYTVTWGLDRANFGGGISAVRTRMGGRASSTDDAVMAFQLSFDPVIAKNDTQVLTLTFRHSWARTP